MMDNEPNLIITLLFVALFIPLFVGYWSMYLWLKDHNQLIEGLLASKKINLEMHKTTDKNIDKLFYNDKILHGMCIEEPNADTIETKNIMQ